MRRWIALFVLPVAVVAIALIVGVSLALWIDTETNAANTLSTNTLAAPTSLTASDTPPGSVTLNWTATASAWAGGYNVQRSATSGSGYGFLAAVPGQASSSYVDPVGGGGFETVTFISVATASSSSGVQSLLIAKPAGTAQNDLLLAVLSTDNDDQNNNHTAPAGWTQIVDRRTSCDCGDVEFGVWYKVAGASEPADYTFTWNNGEDAVGAILRYDGVNPAAPIDVSADATGSGTTPTAPDVTTTVANAMVVRLFGSDDDDLPTPVADVYPAGTTGRYAEETNGGGGDTTSAGADLIQAVAGSTGTAAFTLAGSERWVAATVALTPNPVPPATYYYVVEATFQNWTSPFSNEASGDGQTPVVARIGSWGTGTSHTAVAGSNRALVFVAGREQIGQPTLTSVTYGGQALTKVISQDSGTSTYDGVEIWVLNEAGIAAASGSTFVPTWSSAPTGVAYAHAFYENVNQAALTGAQASNSTNSATPNPITTSALANTNGDMVVVGAVSGNSGTYTAQNGFSLGVSTGFSGSGATLGTAEKSGTGAAETPSMQHDGPNRQAIAAFVLQAAP